MSVQFAIGVLTHTPLWVFALLGYLVWQGLSAQRPRSVPVWRLFTVPILFFLIGLSRLVLGHQGLWPVVGWLAGALLFAPFGFFTDPGILAVDRAHGRVTRAGSRMPLIRNVVVFLLQYFVTAANAINPDGHAALALAGRVVSGATSGYFAGWLAALWRRYTRQPGGAEQTD